MGLTLKDAISAVELSITIVFAAVFVNELFVRIRKIPAHLDEACREKHQCRIPGCKGDHRSHV